MGMYTELVMAASFPEDSPCLEELRSMIDGTFDEGRFPNQPIRWGYMLRCDSYYFDGDTRSTLRYDDIAKNYVLTIRCNLKNYEQEIEQFLDWIAPFVEENVGAPDSGFVGYMRYEENEEPTLIYFRDGSVSYRYPAAKERE